jgi:hypothetical protein
MPGASRLCLPNRFGNILMASTTAPRTILELPSISIKIYCVTFEVFMSGTIKNVVF